MPSEIIQTRDELGRFGKKGRRFWCDSCQLMSINGIVCHETGCPDEWMDVKRKCDDCGCDFEPQERYQKFCSPCCAANAYGLECDCDHCAELRAEEDCPDPDRCRGNGCAWHKFAQV